MTIEFTQEQVAFLTAPRHAILATNRPGKSPQISPVWYWFEDGEIYVSLRDDTAKFANLRRDPQLSLCVDGGRSDTRCVIVHGDVEMYGNQHPRQLEMRWQIVQHYIADGAAARTYFETTNDGHPVLIRIQPTRLLTHNFA
ncbi:MAG: PPOX class F420-dependent oxidoreductase [Litorilinea sp.]